MNKMKIKNIEITGVTTYYAIDFETNKNTEKTGFCKTKSITAAVIKNYDSNSDSVNYEIISISNGVKLTTKEEQTLKTAISETK